MRAAACATPARPPASSTAPAQPQLIELDHNALFFALKKEAFHSSILDMELAGKTAAGAAARLQMHPFKPMVLHVDFQRVDATTKLHMKVPLHFINEENSPAVKTDDCVVNHVVNELDIQCLPRRLPEFIDGRPGEPDEGPVAARQRHQAGRRRQGRDARQAESGDRLGRDAAVDEEPAAGAMRRRCGAGCRGGRGCRRPRRPSAAKDDKKAAKAPSQGQEVSASASDVHRWIRRSPASAGLFSLRLACDNQHHHDSTDRRPRQPRAPNTRRRATTPASGGVDAARARAAASRCARARLLRPGRARQPSPSGPLWLLEPMTFMNLSGKSVAALARFFKIAPDEILVAHDELDLLPGQVKLKLGGSHAGHNGLKDIHAQLGTGDYWRLRLGIGHPGVKAEVIDYVLRSRARAARRRSRSASSSSLGALDLLLDGDMERAMMKITRQAAAAQAARRSRSARPSNRRRDGAGTMRLGTRASLALGLALGAAARVGADQPCTAAARATAGALCAGREPVAVDDARSESQRREAQARGARRGQARHAASSASAWRASGEARPLAAAGIGVQASAASASAPAKAKREEAQASTAPQQRIGARTSSRSNRARPSRRSAAPPSEPPARSGLARRGDLRPAAAGTSRTASRASRRAPGPSGCSSTGQTCTHCGSSKWPTHSVQRAGSMT